MNSHLIIQRDYSQNSSIQLLDCAPEPIAVPFLRFASQWVLQDPNAPFLFQVGTLAENLFLEILRKLILCHSSEDSPFYLG